MTILLIMIPLSLVFVGVAAAAFFWAVNHDQFDDMDSPSLAPLSDDMPEATADGARDAEATSAAGHGDGQAGAEGAGSPR